MTRYWSQTLPFASLAERCLAVLSGDAPADTYLIELAGHAWQGACDVMGEEVPVGAQFTISGDSTAEAALVSVASDGLVTLSLPRLRALALQSLELAEHVSRNFVARFLFGMANLPDLVDLDRFEERALPNPDSPWYAPDSGLLIHDLMRSAQAAVSQEPGGPSQALPRFDLGLLPTEIREGRYDLLFDPANGPYVIRLHHHLFVNALLFALIHENAHLSLGHFAADASEPGTQRRWEIAADAEALELLLGDVGGDPRAAISILRHLHAAEPEPAGAHLSHPHSTERLALLAEAVRATGDTALAQDINETLRELVWPGGQVTDEQGHAAELLISGDLDAAYVEARVREEVSDDLTWAIWDRRPRIAIRTAVTCHDLVNPEMVLANATVHIYFSDKIHMSFDEDTGILTHIMRARIPTPPAWRLNWPDARLAITSVTDIPQEPGPDDMAALLVMRDKKRSIVWNIPDEELLGIEALVAGEPVQADAPTYLEWARWCDDYDCSAEALFLRATVAEQARVHMPDSMISDVLKDLLSVDDTARAHRIALTYIEQTTRVLPGMQYVFALKAVDDGDPLAAFDHAFAEIHGFGPDTEFGSAAQPMFFQVLAEGSAEPDLAALLDYFRLYEQFTSARSRGRRRRFLVQGREILDRRLTSRALDLLSVQQLRAEAYGHAWRMGESGADVTAAHIFEQLIADHPWFVAAGAQLAHLYLDQGNREAALQCVRHAEQIAPAHPQIMDVRRRLVHATT